MSTLRVSTAHAITIMEVLSRPWKVNQMSGCHFKYKCLFVYHLYFLSDQVEFELSGFLVVDMWDHDTMNQDDFMGQVMIPLRDVPQAVNPKEEWHCLRKRTAKDKVNGSLLLEVSLSMEKKQVGIACNISSSCMVGWRERLRISVGRSGLQF